MKKYIVAAAGFDQPGIVQALSKALFDIGANLEDTTMNQMEDHFMVMMIVQSHDDLEALRGALKEATANFGLMLNVYSTDIKLERVERSGTPWLMNITSPDQTGIVYKVSNLLMSWKANIYHLSSRRMIKESGNVFFLLSMEVDIPVAISEESIEHHLEMLGKEYQLDIQAHPLETYVL